MITLATLPQATAQEVYDQAVEHCVRQGRRSMDKRMGYCAYRGDNDLKCAAGCLIADDEYSEEFEGHEWRELVDARLVPTAHADLIRELQNAHDLYLCDGVEVFLERCRRIAIDRGLNPYAGGVG